MSSSIMKIPIIIGRENKDLMFLHWHSDLFLKTSMKEFFQLCLNIWKILIFTLIQVYLPRRLC